MAKGKRAQWMGDDKVVHSFTFTPDCGKAIWLLSQKEDAWNQVWHMPTAAPALTGKEIISLAATIFKVTEKHSNIGKGMIGLAGIFMRLMYEMKEMFTSTMLIIFSIPLNLIMLSIVSQRAIKKGLKSLLMHTRPHQIKPGRALLKFLRCEFLILVF